jgi:hypothetical protein
MRAFLAGALVFGGLLAGVALLGALGLMEVLPSWALGLVLCVWMFALVGFALVAFNRPGVALTSVQSFAEQVRTLEEQDLLLSQPFMARRAFAVEEFEDEGSHYYIELEDGSVLFLSGQYLYDYEPDDDPRYRRPRRFPCSAFTIRRHRHEGYAVDIQCTGSTLEPEVTTPSFGEEVWSDGGVPEDGSIIKDATYDSLKGERLRRAG